MWMGGRWCVLGGPGIDVMIYHTQLPRNSPDDGRDVEVVELPAVPRDHVAELVAEAPTIDSKTGNNQPRSSQIVSTDANPPQVPRTPWAP